MSTLNGPAAGAAPAAMAAPPAKASKGMSAEVSKVVLDALGRGMTRGQISGVVGVSKRAITRISSNMKKHGTPKAPPTGAKLGRPVKLTKAQADAMIVWMAARDHTFYVKDLVAYLKEQYRYKGCDGTIRRCLVRAGYTRKLPWHKSETTVWVPPNYRPVFVIAQKGKKPGKKTGKPGLDDDDDDEVFSDDVDDGDGVDDQDAIQGSLEPPPQVSPSFEHQDAQVQNDIDPSLEMQPLPPQNLEQENMQQNFMSSAYSQSVPARQSPPNPFNFQPQDADQVQYGQAPLLPLHHQPQILQQGPSVHLLQSPPPQQETPAEPEEFGASGSKQPQQQQKTKARTPRKSTKKPDSERLRRELEEKNAIIAQLQAQLQQQYSTDGSVGMAQFQQQQSMPTTQDQRSHSPQQQNQLSSMQHFTEFQPSY